MEPVDALGWERGARRGLRPDLTSGSHKRMVMGQVRRLADAGVGDPRRERWLERVRRRREGAGAAARGGGGATARWFREEDGRQW